MNTLFLGGIWDGEFHGTYRDTLSATHEVFYVYNYTIVGTVYNLHHVVSTDINTYVYIIPQADENQIQMYLNLNKHLLK